MEHAGEHQKHRQPCRTRSAKGTLDAPLACESQQRRERAKGRTDDNFRCVTRPDEKILATYGRYQHDLDLVAQKLIEEANGAGGVDNITVIVIRFGTASN